MTFRDNVTQYQQYNVYIQSARLSPIHFNRLSHSVQYVMHEISSLDTLHALNKNIGNAIKLGESEYLIRLIIFEMQQT